MAGVICVPNCTVNEGVTIPGQLPPPVPCCGSGPDPDGLATEVTLAGFSSSFLTSIGTPSDLPWNGSDVSATVISLLKTIAQNTGTT